MSRTKKSRVKLLHQYYKYTGFYSFIWQGVKSAILPTAIIVAILFYEMQKKYIAGDPISVKNIGMAHGVLFILYVAFAILIKNEQKWNLKTFIIVCLASIVPFGTFYIEKKYLQNS